jgi:hypothetical protein
MEAERFTSGDERPADVFARRAFLAQSADYAGAMGWDLLRTFRWRHAPFAGRFSRPARSEDSPSPRI